MAELLQQDAPGWAKFVTDFDNTYNSFMTNYDALLKVGPFVQRFPTMFPQTEYDKLVNDGADTYNKLNQLKATRDAAVSWLNWLRDGATGVFEWFGQTTGLYGNSLGFLPALPVIVSGIWALSAAMAAVTAAAYVTGNIIQYAQRNNMVQDLLSRIDPATGKPYTIDKIQSMVESVHGKPGSGGVLGFLGIPVEMIVFAAIAIFLGPPIIRALTGGRD